MGEELTYDYHYELLSGEGYPCHCGASKCRGRLYWIFKGHDCSLPSMQKFCFELWQIKAGQIGRLSTYCHSSCLQYDCQASLLAQRKIHQQWQWVFCATWSRGFFPQVDMIPKCSFVYSALGRKEDANSLFISGFVLFLFVVCSLYFVVTCLD